MSENIQNFLDISTEKQIKEAFIDIMLAVNNMMRVIKFSELRDKKLTEEQIDALIEIAATHDTILF